MQRPSCTALNTLPLVTRAEGGHQEGLVLKGKAGMAMQAVLVPASRDPVPPTVAAAVESFYPCELVQLWEQMFEAGEAPGRARRLPLSVAHRFDPYSRAAKDRVVVGHVASGSMVFSEPGGAPTGLAINAVIHDPQVQARVRAAQLGHMSIAYAFRFESVDGTPLREEHAQAGMPRLAVGTVFRTETVPTGDPNVRVVKYVYEASLVEQGYYGNAASVHVALGEGTAPPVRTAPGVRGYPSIIMRSGTEAGRALGTYKGEPGAVRTPQSTNATTTSMEPEAADQEGPSGYMEVLDMCRQRNGENDKEEMEDGNEAHCPEGEEGEEGTWQNVMRRFAADQQQDLLARLQQQLEKVQEHASRSTNPLAQTLARAVSAQFATLIARANRPYDLSAPDKCNAQLREGHDIAAEGARMLEEVCGALSPPADAAGASASASASAGGVGHKRKRDDDKTGGSVRRALAGPAWSSGGGGRGERHTHMGGSAMEVGATGESTRGDWSTDEMRKGLAAALLQHGPAATLQHFHRVVKQNPSLVRRSGRSPSDTVFAYGSDGWHIESDPGLVQRMSRVPVGDPLSPAVLDPDLLLQCLQTLKLTYTPDPSFFFAPDKVAAVTHAPTYHLGSSGMRGM